MKQMMIKIGRTTTMLAASAVVFAAASTLPAVAQIEALHIDATGNVGIGTASPQQSLHLVGTDGTTKFLVEETNGTKQARELFKLSNKGGPFFVFADTSLAQSFAFSMGSTGDFLISHQQTPGVQFRLSQNGNLSITGSLSQGSSREIKRDIVPIDGRDVLARVLELPIQSWSYVTDADGVRHLGPMAEDFHALFSLGDGNTTIASLDTSGVALAAIQGLDAELRQKDEEIRRLQTEKDTLALRLSELEKTVAALVEAR
ncbi:MAG: tail fiber domain-containing protein [Halioglobus sp.]|nr:tail fiber domain-containing protein [Halioglobus sp.]